MRRGEVIYLFDDDLNLIAKDRITNIRNIEYYHFASHIFSKEDRNKADMVVYVSEKYQDTKVLKNKF